MTRAILLAATIMVGFTLTQGAFARGGGGDFPREQAPAHASSEARQNSNGKFSGDRDKGLARAEDRMSKEGLSHEKTTDHTKKKKGNPTP